jgi:hypothetical protein
MRNPDLHKPPLTKAILLWLVFLLSGLFSFSQTPISGFVNSYYRVSGVNLTDDAVRINPSTFGISAGDRMLLIQMKGATINTASTTSSAWGDTTALNNAGNYEMAIVCRVTIDSVYFVHEILNNYTPANNTVQLVKFAEYESANVTDTLRTVAWNSASGTGGVLALFVEEDLILSKPIVADGTGFSGGAFFLSNTGCNNSTSGYAYNGAGTLGTQSGAYKGEAIATPVATQSGGRGGVANGGGGGNNHNNGGGGGANLTRGGIGGGNSSSSPGGCNASFPGEPGKALSNWGGRKIFLGGGGGAGHNNNAPAGVTTLSIGGKGGGIIIIHANRIIGNGQRITANGGQGGNSASDGAGGAGAAGTIIMDVASGYDDVTIQANGGVGGTSSDGGNIKRCYGAGGGGSGGAIYLNGSTPSGPGISVTVDAGPAGVEIGSDPACNPQVFSGAGNPGQIINSYTIKMSSSLATYCSTVLPVRLISFKATVIQKKVKLQWSITQPDAVNRFEVQKLNAGNQWTTFSSVAANDMQTDYTLNDENPFPGYNSYRLKTIEKSGFVFYSLIRRVYIESENDQFTLYPNPAHDKIFIKGNYNGFIDLKMLDITGKPVMMKRMVMNRLSEIALPALSAGVYTLYINNAIKKLVIR